MKDLIIKDKLFSSIKSWWLKNNSKMKVHTSGIGISERRWNLKKEMICWLNNKGIKVKHEKKLIKDVAIHLKN
jgi:hypothetical protein